LRETLPVSRNPVLHKTPRALDQVLFFQTHCVRQQR
jgi:hypothetical protein